MLCLKISVTVFFLPSLNGPIFSENPDLTVLVNDEVVSKRSKLAYDMASVDVVLNSLAIIYEGYLSSSFSILTIGNLAFEKSPIIDVPFSMA